MKKLFVIVFFAAFTLAACAQDKSTLRLLPPDMERAATLMKALSERISTREFSAKELSLQDLSDLLWAANGVNRPQSGKRTAPSARNRMDIHVYVCMAGANYSYDPVSHELRMISTEDVRGTDAPVCIVLAADTDDAATGFDAGIVSQNISLFCAAAGMGTVCRATFPDKEAMAKALLLPQGHSLQLNHPVGYLK